MRLLFFCSTRKEYIDRALFQSSDLLLTCTFRGNSMSKVRPSSMYSKSEETEEENTKEDKGEEEEEGSAVNFILTVVSFILILITFPFSIWKCVKVIKVGAFVKVVFFSQVAQEYERVVILRLGRVQKSGVKYN